MENKPLHITVLGMGDHPEAMLSNGSELLRQHRFFSGGKRHYELLKSILPEEHTWIEISGSMNEVVAQYKEIGDDPLLVITSGDPLFYGFANTLKRLVPNAQLEVIPWFSSIQRLSHKAQLSANNLTTVTLHGRSWKALDATLIEGHKTIGILTDKTHAPNAIAKRLLAFGFTEYRMIVGEHLDGKEERIYELSLSEAEGMEFADLSAVILQQETTRNRPTSFPDHFYRTLEGRPGMITKQSLRAITLQALQLSKEACFWDVGSCTGAIAIEAKQQRPWADVVAFEIRPECEAIIDENTQNTATPGIEVKIGDFFDQELSVLPTPNAVFIGGHGGKLKEMIAEVDCVLAPEGRIVMNTVSEDSLQGFKNAIAPLGYEIDTEMRVQINEFNQITLIGATKLTE